MKRKRISQREAMRLRKRVKELQDHISRIEGCFGKKRICELQINDYSAGRISMIEEMDHVITVRKQHREDGKHVFVLDAVPKIKR